MIAVRDRYDITGQKFNHLVVLGPSHRDERGSVLWTCRCVCGKDFAVPSSRLRNGRTRSCGCRKFDNIAERKVKHGHARRGRKSVYGIWMKMLRRCYDPKDSQYERYGGRGIKVCDRWRTSIDAFASDMGPRPSRGHSIDRKDNDGNYEPGNCKWSTTVEQENNRRTNVFVEFDGKRLTINEWERATGISQYAIRHRLKKGWTVRDVLTKPMRVTHRSDS